MKRISFCILLISVIIYSCRLSPKLTTNNSLKEKKFLDSISCRVLRKDTLITIEVIDSIYRSIKSSKTKDNLEVLFAIYSNYYREVNADSSFKYCNQALYLATETKNDSLLLAMYLQKADLTQDDTTYIVSLRKADSLAKKNNRIEDRAFINKSFWDYYAVKDPIRGLYYIDTAAHYLIAGNKVKAAGLLYQNSAFMFDEKRKDHVLSAKYAQKSIACYKMINDTINEANLLKYLAVQQAQNGDFNYAKASVNSAIEKFNYLKFYQGVAVSYFALGIVYEQQGVNDSAVYFMNEAKKMWISYNDKNRVFIINNALMKIYLGSKSLSALEELFIENKAIAESINIQELNLLNFFKCSMELFSFKRDEASYDDYKKKYQQVRESLIKKGYNVD